MILKEQNMIKNNKKFAEKIELKMLEEINASQRFIRRKAYIIFHLQKTIG